jgi:outer membrane protein OmpA-like peptidoglycan-associated protein
MRRHALIAVFALSLAACTVAAPRPPQSFVVFFTPFSAALDDTGQTVVTTAAKAASDDPKAGVHVVGFASPVGGAAVNDPLALTRAQLVVAQLVQDGVSADRIVVSSRGPTDVKLSDVESRRVEIDVGP